MLKREAPPRAHKAKRKEKLVNVDRHVTIGMVVNSWVEYLQLGYPGTDKRAVCNCPLDGHRPSTGDVHSLDKSHSMIQCLAQLHINVF